MVKGLQKETMKKKRKLGIYIGNDGMAFAEVEGRNIISSRFLTFSALEEEISAEEFTSQIKIGAMLQRGLRELKTELKSAHIGLSDKDSIFRFLNLPFMRKKELELALPLEAEKYIPFKTNEIIWDYKAKNIMRERKMEVAFAGIKRQQVNEIKDIFKEAGIAINSVESSSFATIGTLFFLNIISKKDKNFVVFLLSQREGEINIFSDNFPYFCRYAKIPTDEEGNLNTIRLIDELRLTLDYYRREVGKENLEKLFIVGAKSDLDSFTTVSTELNITTERIVIEDIFAERKIFTLQEFKAFSLSLRDVRRPLLKFNFLKEEKIIKPKIPVVPAPLKAEEITWNLKPLLGVLGVGALLFLGVLFVYSQKETQNIIQLRKLEKHLQGLAFSHMVSSLSLDDLEAKNAELDNILNQAKKNISIPKDTVPFISLIGESVSDGMWFDEVKLERGWDLKNISLSIRGSIYLNDATAERESLSKFITALKSSVLIRSHRLRVVLKSKEQRTNKGYEITVFEVGIE